jgi:hypothetical protein
VSSPNEYAAAAPGALGATLTQGGYRARVVIERVDGEPLTDDDREILANTLAARWKTATTPRSASTH